MNALETTLRTLGPNATVRFLTGKVIITTDIASYEAPTLEEAIQKSKQAA